MRNPPVNVEWTLARVKQLYGIEVIKVKQLDSYEDTNYYIKTSESEQLIVKITNAELSNEHGLIEGINGAIFHLNNNCFNVTIPIMNKQGTYLTFEQIPAPDQQLDSNSPKYGFRILKYIPGKILRDVSITPAILRECGEVLAKITIALETYTNSALRNRKSFFSLFNLLAFKQYLSAVDSPSDRNIMTRAMNQFETQVLNNQDKFECSMIHNDFNDQNIIVDTTTDEKTGQEVYHVKGVIDFNEMQWAPKVFDLGIHLAYSMLGQFDACPQVLIPGFGLLGYLRHKSLTQNELNVLYYCIKGRLCQSLLMAAHKYRLNPTNIYAQSTTEKGWPALRALDVCEPKDILNKWLNVDKQFPN